MTSPSLPGASVAFLFNLATAHFIFIFVLAAVSTVIIGHDFQQSHHFLVDPVHHRLIDSRDSTIISDSALSTTTAISHIPPPVQKLLKSYPTTLGTDLHAHHPTSYFITPLTPIHTHCPCSPPGS
jgi:hypothetical protein